MSRVLLSIQGFHPKQWYDLLSARRVVVLEPDGLEDPSIDYAVVWKQQPGMLSTLPNLKAIFSIGAGVDHIFADPDVPDVPVVRVVADNLSQYMREYVVWRVLAHHRQEMTYRDLQSGATWHELQQPTANDVSVGIMGFGQLGRATAATLLQIGFKVNGWSRRETSMDGVSTFAGDDGLSPFLGNTDILVVLLPLTTATHGIIDYGILKQLRPDGAPGGPALINAGRGQLQKEADILRALDDGTLKEASLDVFETEPLPAESALWAHPRVFVTPHAAATSDPDYLVPQMLAQMDACDRGEPLANLVDRTAGY